MFNKISLKQIEKAIQKAHPKDQQHLLNDLPRLLKISPSKIGLLKITEPSFNFWDNSEDDIYNSL